MDSVETGEIDPALERLTAAIDPSSSVPVSVQLRGALEYGIAAGDIPANTRLPSVRRLAAILKLSPVTVSGVYAALQERGHVAGRIGSGTFVADRARPPATQARKLEDFQRQVSDLIQLGLELGLSRQDIAFRVSMAPEAAVRPMRILMLGTFPDATTAYAADLASYLNDRDSISAASLADIEKGQVVAADLVVCPHTLTADAARLFPDIAVFGITLIPNEQTRIALAGIPPEAKVGVVSYFDDFLPTLKSGVNRFAPHLGRVTAVPRGYDGLPDLLSEVDTLIYSTGAGYLREGLRPKQSAIEYRHTPDSHDVRSKLLPAIETIRVNITTKETQDEDK
ncbi:GntR family transcriptional regulator [Sulfitobacter sp. F26204]|uniref:GntR family transcriptional regulator n=1 Tax=Sulfitobacter sp. F26204 TaxID=2996014 RepID=UPI00225E05EE|nr:GntR family transcriptional regulator [Sulfitobacter sp. F26204]MCX7561597.1 GntR family transcriptional regulator [Sulfitobacter sp. F26204]